MDKILIFNIQRYSIHDGGGIRTLIFLKGCPLRCPWCANPESQSFDTEMMRKPSLCIGCSSSSCAQCINTPEGCPTGALELVGQAMTIDEIINEVKKDLIFYDSTGGGVTLSGGEPLAQSQGAIKLLRALKALGVDTALETSGFGKWQDLNEMSNYLDRVLFDLKIMDSVKSKEILHGDSGLIEENFRNLVAKGIEVIPRVPLIPGFTMEEHNIDAIINLVVGEGIREVHILPFHQYGSSKYKGLGRTYQLDNLNPPTEEEVSNVKEKMENRGLYVVVGGK